MRSSLLLASALAMGALASPIERRVLKTVQKVVATVEVDVAVRIGADGKPYTTQTIATHAVGEASAAHVKPTTSCSTPAQVTQRPTYQPPPPPKPVQPTSTCSSTSKAYKPPPAPTTTSVYVPPPAPSTTSSTYVPPPPSTLTTTQAPAPTYAPPSYGPPPPPPSTTTQAPPPPPSSTPQYGVEHKSGEIQASFSSGIDYQDAMLWHHNRARANHEASNLEWSEDCVAGAQKAADTCVFEHVITKGQGQNLYATSGDAYNATAAVTEAFYKDEADLYSYWGQEPPHDPANPDAVDEEIFHAWGHLTQVLWKETTHVGCVTVNCPGMETNRYTVCNYFPAGNMATKFAENVVKPSKPYNKYSWTD